jgi:predicted TIM-barrel fold metal-dependent hydrolase
LYQGKGDVTPAELHSFIQAFPDLRVVAAHFGGGYPIYELMPEVHASAANLWYDSAAALYLYRSDIFPLVAGIAGIQKILWGSDFPLISQRRMLDYTKESGLDPEELALALGGNAAAFLRI